MLVFVGLGLTKEGISLEGLKEARSADRVYIELYTSIIPGLTREELERLIERPVREVGRKEIEESPEEILSAAKAGKVVLLVPGDPMIATTHVSLRLRAERNGIKTRVVHAGSILSAVAGATGLQSYKFGPSATIPFEDNLSSRPYDVLAENISRGLHTLLLLDLRMEEKRAMTLSEGMRIMLRLEEEHKRGVFTEDTLVVGVARAGCADCIVATGRVKDLLSLDFGSPPHALVVPGKLHFLEAEALQIFSRSEAPIYISSTAMRQIEERAEALGFPRLLLMENAGRAVADFIFTRGFKRVVVVAGTGDNGGDGFVAARYLSKGGASVDVFLVGREEEIKSEKALLNWNRLKQIPGIQLMTMASEEFWRKLSTSLSAAEVVVDAIFGIGLKGEVREPHASVIELINSASAFKVAVDIPSGLDPDSGKILGKAVRANTTLTFHRPKLGLRENPEIAGEIIVVDIGIPLEAGE